MDGLWSVLWGLFLVSALAPMVQVLLPEMARLSRASGWGSHRKRGAPGHAQEERHIMTADTFYRTVMDTSAVRDREQAKQVTAAVFHVLRDRITQRESDQLFAQLPWELQAVWVIGEREDREPVKMHRQAFYERVRQEADLASLAEAREATLAVFAALKKQISPGEADDVLAQLPKDLKEVWLEAKVPA